MKLESELKVPSSSSSESAAISGLPADGQADLCLARIELDGEVLLCGLGWTHCSIEDNTRVKSPLDECSKR